MPSQALARKDWTPGTVYLVQFPRAGCIPSPSPFALKLETWLRMTDIPYENVDNEMTKVSEKGQIPFVELNGRQIPDSNQVLDYLTTEFHKEYLDAGLSPLQLAEKRAFMHLLEQSIFWAMAYNRCRSVKWFATEQGWLGNFSGIKKIVFKNIFMDAFKKRVTNAVYAQGYGRHSPSEIDEIMCRDLDALSTLLGDNDYFFMSTPGTFDATAFGHLCQIAYTPMLSDTVKNHLKNKCKNLDNFLYRMKDRFWPDWDKACEELSLHTQWKMKEKIQIGR